MGSKMKKNDKLIPIKIDNPSVYRSYKASTEQKEIDFEPDFDNLTAEVVSINQFIRGILWIPIKGGKKIKFIPTDKIFSFNNSLDFSSRDRTEDELEDDKICGRFQYTKSLSAIDKFRFNRELGIDKKIRKKLQKICSDLIHAELAKQRIQIMKKK